MRSLALTSLLALTLTACTKSPTESAIENAVFARAGGALSNAAASVYLLPTADPGSSITAGDNLFGGRYQDGRCGVTATVFFSGSNDFISHTTSNSAGDRKCAPYGSSAVPRRLHIDYGNGVEVVPGGVNVLNIGTVTSGSAYRQVGIPLTGSARCTRLQFSATDPAEQVLVTKVTGGWSVAGTGRTARCLNASNIAVATYTLNVSFTVTTP